MLRPTALSWRLLECKKRRRWFPASLQISLLSIWFLPSGPILSIPAPLPNRRWLSSLLASLLQFLKPCWWGHYPVWSWKATFIFSYHLLVFLPVVYDLNMQLDLSLSFFKWCHPFLNGWKSLNPSFPGLIRHRLTYHKVIMALLLLARSSLRFCTYFGRWTIRQVSLTVHWLVIRLHDFQFLILWSGLDYSY